MSETLLYDKNNQEFINNFNSTIDSYTYAKNEYYVREGEFLYLNLFAVIEKCLNDDLTTNPNNGVDKYGFQEILNYFSKHILKMSKFEDIKSKMFNTLDLTVDNFINN